MIILSNIHKIDSWTKDNLYVVSDFDRTLTTHDSCVTWDLITNLKPSVSIKMKELYEYYRPIELDNSLKFIEKSEILKEWWNKEIEILVDCNFSEECINNAVKNNGLIKFRKGMPEFLKALSDYNIPVIIKSAGIENFIRQALINNKMYYDNIHILSNNLKFQSGIVCGIDGQIIHTLNKNTIAIPSAILEKIKYRNNILLMGDSLEDIHMVDSSLRNNTLRIGFLGDNKNENLPYYYKEFDIICTGDENMNQIVRALRKTSVRYNMYTIEGEK